MEALRRLPGMAVVSRMITDYANVAYQSRMTGVTLQAVDEQFWEISRYNVVAGRFFDAQDVKMRSKVCVLGEQLALRIFGHTDVVDFFFLIEQNLYKVVGVLGGVVTSTFLVTLFAPLFYVMIYKALGKHRKREKTEKAESSQTTS